jgi:hypothetical protein
MTNKRIDDFIAVAATRYDANPKVWTYLYESLYRKLPESEHLILEARFHPIAHKKELEEWDELFLETTIDESKLADQLNGESAADIQRKQYELYRQQMAGMQNAVQYTPGGYVNPYGGAISTTGTGGLHPVQTGSSVTTTLWDRIIGRK